MHHMIHDILRGFQAQFFELGCPNCRSLEMQVAAIKKPWLVSKQWLFYSGNDERMVFFDGMILGSVKQWFFLWLIVVSNDCFNGQAVVARQPWLVSKQRWFYSGKSWLNMDDLGGLSPQWIITSG